MPDRQKDRAGNPGSERETLPCFGSYRKQRTVFTALNLLVLGALLLCNAFLPSLWGRSTGALVALLVVAFLGRCVELGWHLQQQSPLSLGVSARLTLASIGLNLMLAFILACVVDRADSQYFALLIIPILEAAFRFSLGSTLGVVAVADSLTFFWVWRYYQAHPPADIAEYLEAGTLSGTFLIVGVLTVTMLRQLRRQGEELEMNMAELEKTRERLVREEGLAAVGRLSEAIAHEIRNPVTIISSSLATARQLSGDEREEMIEIADKEATRLVNLTTDFLAYARPRRPDPALASVRDVVTYVAAVCKAQSRAKNVGLQVEAAEAFQAQFDFGMLQQALMNLAMNAVDASPAGETVRLTVQRDKEERITIEVTNRGGPIPSGSLSRLFEPFFSTKRTGTGLGLATARNIVRAFGGEVWLSKNEASEVSFSITIPERWQAALTKGGQERTWAGS